MSMNTYKLNYYIFLDELNEKIIKNIQNLKIRKNNLRLIISEKIFFSISDFIKHTKIPFFIIDNIKLATKHRAHGIFLTSRNKSLINIPINSQRIEVIGSAHNQYEYFIKEKQQCKTIFLSPIFYNEKYSKNKILNIIKFNLITLNWKNNIGALGGIKFKNLKLINLTRSKSIGVKSLVTA